MKVASVSGMNLIKSLKKLCFRIMKKLCFQIIRNQPQNLNNSFLAELVWSKSFFRPVSQGSIDLFKVFKPLTNSENRLKVSNKTLGQSLVKSSNPELFLVKGFLKICSKFTGEHPCRSMISISNFIEITLRHGCSPVNLLHFSEHLFLRTPLDGGFCLKKSPDEVTKTKIAKFHDFYKKLQIVQ